MIILPVPPSRPCLRMRTRFALVPGLSDSYLSRIALTAGVMLIWREAPLLPIRFGSALRYRSGARRTNRRSGDPELRHARHRPALRSLPTGDRPFFAPAPVDGGDDETFE